MGYAESSDKESPGSLSQSTRPGPYYYRGLCVKSSKYREQLREIDDEISDLGSDYRTTLLLIRTSVNRGNGSICSTNY